MTPREIVSLMAASLYATRVMSSATYGYADAVREAEALWNETRLVEVRVCQECGNRFRARGAGGRARFCGAPCRLKAWRKERAGFRMPHHRAVAQQGAE